jgi:hypothetical protein
LGWGEEGGGGGGGKDDVYHMKEKLIDL